MDYFSVMALPYSEEESGVLTKEEKRNALVKLLLTVMAVDAAAIAIYLILVLELGWDETVPFILLIVVTVITGFYFQWQNNKITNK
jgi:CHASE2 domain-containing sensor protein